ncbi:MAG: folate family ECF transporter S component [Christensenellaceae bacterium]|jgi:ECF transporter S component (folate family)|nr:folate family ECF transporter S component [Christensenellaceae bacterium]
MPKSSDFQGLRAFFLRLWRGDPVPKAKDPSEFLSLQGVFSPRHLALLGIMATLSAVLSRFTIPLAQNLVLLRFSYLPEFIVGMLLGPWAALLFGAVADTVSFLSNPIGAYFPGYALSEMLASLIYACYFYRRPVSLWRALLARATYIALVAFGLNYLWDFLLSGKPAASFFTGFRLLNNLIQLPFHALLMTFVGLEARRIYSRLFAPRQGR